jgi:lytic cellulose monooxygenase (C1-hydroxylating)
MHAQPGDRNCRNEAIGGNHDGPVIVYLSRVSDAKSSPGSNWFKIYQNGLVRPDYWGTDDLNANCGKQDLKIPSDIAPGDYLLRTEVIALHVAGSAGGAQHYVTCFQLKITGNGTANPKGVSFPGAYSV